MTDTLVTRGSKRDGLESFFRLGVGGDSRLYPALRFSGWCEVFIMSCRHIGESGTILLLEGTPVWWCKRCGSLKVGDDRWTHPDTWNIKKR